MYAADDLKVKQAT